MRTLELFSGTGDLPQNILEIIRNYLPVKDTEKKLFGEVFTPVELICEMLDKLPKEVWSNPELKWLDPANGVGNFPLVAYYRLMDGLKDVVKDREERSKHIIENMLYMVELNPINCKVCKKIFKMIDGKANPNIVTGDFLEEFIKTKNFRDKTNKFDIVMGNPPYQAVSVNLVSKGGGNNLYTKFIYGADKNLNENGYLLFINPPTYFSPGRSNNMNTMNLRKDIFNNYYHYYINLEECSKHFNVGSKFIYYLIQKNLNKNSSVEIICKYNKTIYNTTLSQELLIRDYLPYLLTHDCLKILDKVKNNDTDKLPIFNSPDNRSDKKHVLKKKNDTDKLPIFNSSVFDKRRPYVLKKNKKETNEQYIKRAIENGYIYPIQATGVQVVYSSKKCKNQNDKKVLMSRSGYLKPFYDNGILGVGGHCLACLVKDEYEGNKIIQLLNSKLYTFYIETNKWSGFHNKKVLQDLPNIVNEIEHINDKNIYRYFEITEKEQQNLNLW